MIPVEKKKGDFHNRLWVTLQVVITSAVAGSVAGFALPLIQEHLSEEKRIETYLENISRGSILKVIASQSQTEAKSPASNYSTTLQHLLNSAHFEQRKSFDQSIGDAGSWEARGWRNYEYCYPSVKSLPAGRCVVLDDFRFSEAGLIESFEINDMPVAALASITSERSDRVHRGEEEKDIKVYRKSVLTDPDLSESFISFDLQYDRSTQDAPNYLLLHPVPVLQNRLENSLAGYAILPAWAYEFETNVPFSIHVQNTGTGFAYLCTKPVNKDQIAVKFEEVAGEQTCSWISL